MKAHPEGPGNTVGTIRQSLRLLLSCYLAALCASTTTAEPPSASASKYLMPAPAAVERCEGPGVLLSKTLPLTLTVQPGLRLQSALRQFEDATGIRLPDGDLLRINIATPGYDYPSVNTEESYSLRVDKGIELRAQTELGAMRGLQTLTQMVLYSRHLPCITVEDRPRHPWRGLLLDVVRHWMPPSVIRRQLDAMARYKMNVLHWHLSDDQSFRVESKLHPNLHMKGSDGNFYTQEEIRALIDYAADRGIRVVPEFDLPGHSRSWQIAYPQLSSVPGKEYLLYHQDSIFSDPINPVTDENLALIQSIVSEMSALFPDAYFHMGGDEVNTDAWKNNEKIQAFIEQKQLRDEKGLQAWFIRQYQQMLSELDKTAIGWDEVAESDYPKGAVINKWRDLSFTEAEKNNPLVVSSGFYLDHMQTAWRHYQNDPADFENADGAFIMGGEASAWAETIDAETVDMRVWPRTLAIAELLWSPDAWTEAQSESSLYHRMEYHSSALSKIGLNHESHMSDWFQQLLGKQHAQPVITLASVVRPEMHAQLADEILKLLRWPWDKSIENSPSTLDPFLGHIHPEPIKAWRFNQTVERYLEHRSQQDYEILHRQLTLWRDNHQALLAAITNAGPLKEYDLDELSLGLKELSESGLAALSALHEGHPLRNSGRHRKRAERYAFIDPEMSKEWFKAQILNWENLFRPLILLKAKLPIQRGVASLVQAAGKPRDS